MGCQLSDFSVDDVIDNLNEERAEVLFEITADDLKD